MTVRVCLQHTKGPGRRGPATRATQCGGRTGHHDVSVLTENDLADCIDELDAAAASGPDDIPALLLKRCKEQLKTPLLKLWKTSMDTGVIPDQMKLGMFSHAHPQGR